MNEESGIKEILLAEDEEHIAKLVSFKLGKEGFSVTIARNGQEAVDLLEAKPWCLVILDIMMPIKTGWEVLRVLREHPKESIKELSVLMLTAKGLHKEVANAAELGVQQYLKKPFDPNELAQVVKKLVNL